MKQRLKIILGIVGGIILLFIIDLGCIFIINRPLLAIKKADGRVYKGLFYDAYNCDEYPTLQIKSKGTKFTCSQSNAPENKEVIINSNKEFKIERYRNYDTIKYNLYYENNERRIYFAGDIKEFYIIDDKETNLKDFITTTFQTFEDSMNFIIEKMDKTDILKDGGTTIYKSKELDLTITICNTIEKNKNIYFNNYKSQFDESMCK